ELWDRYRRYLCRCPSVGLSLDISRMNFGEDFFDRMGPAMSAAMEAMADLEAGAIANPNENRQVGHYWLRAPDLAPEESTGQEVRNTIERMKQFAADIHAGRIQPPGGGQYNQLLLIGIGGSALGPQLVADALGGTDDALVTHFCDNTDPDGFDRTFERLGPDLARTLVVVVSKSGGTIETRNAMLETGRHFARVGVDFTSRAVAVTQAGSALHRRSQQQNWLNTFPMWDWVGGRTSVTSAVGLLPAALQGIDVDGLLAGAREMDVVTRNDGVSANPAALMALMWHHATDGRGAKDLVVIPYKDRLALLAKYLQQLVMESLGKETDLGGRTVHQGLTVYGNKGSTDQHAYVQQLREGVPNFFVTFIGVQRDRTGESAPVEPDVTSGDYLHGFLLGTRAALHEKGRESMTLLLDELTPRSLGALVALYERTVGLYASLINVNAYHQPGVEAGKQAAAGIIELQRRLLAELRSAGGEPRTAEQLTQAIEAPDETETAYHVLEHLAANPDRGVTRSASDGPSETRYAATAAES
ncbi:MAG: glucose-6-phosphate isomerase, partial [bacterium]|nr:glucose-6-phosphate isomerase [bacterium]